jgi:hypothetical protein
MIRAVDSTIDCCESLEENHNSGTGPARPAQTLRDAAPVTPIRILADVVLHLDIWL